MSHENQGSYEFGSFHLDPVQQQLLENGKPVALTPKAFDTLLVLVRNHGRLVTKDELLETVWSDSFVEESTVAQNIFRLRKALRDDGPETVFIETVPKRGYRFVGEVRFEEPVEVQQRGRQSSEPRSQPSPEPRPRKGAIWIVVGIAVLVVGVGGAFWLARSRAPRSAAAPSRIMLAVLPVENLTGDPNREYLSDGLTEEIIAQLGSLSPQRLGVIARTSSMTYKGTSKTVDQIGRELGADYLLESSVRSSGDRLRVTIQLIRTRDQSHLWADSYDRVLGDVLTFQSDVGREIAHVIPLSLTGEQLARLGNVRPVKPEAYDAYLKGRFFWNKRTPEDMTRAETYFQQAIQADPSFAPGYAGLADCDQLMVNLEQLKAQDGFSRARVAAMKALELDKTLAEAHVSLASIKGDFDWDWQGAEDEYKQALELNPNYATAHHWYGEFLAAMGRFDEATREIEKAQQVDPLSPVIGVTVAQMDCRVGQCERAIEQLKKTLEIYPDFAEAHQALAEIYAYQGMYDQSVAELKYQRQLSDIGSILLRGFASAKAGRRQEALDVLHELESRADLQHKNYCLAIVHATLGEKDPAFAELESARQAHDPWVAYFRSDIKLTDLRSDPRYAGLIGRMNMPR